MTRLWSLQRDRQLTHNAYSEIGGVQKALANHAEAVYSFLSETRQQQTQRIFLQLVRPGEGTEDTRRLANRAEVGEENWDLVRYLAGESARLVVTGRNETTGEETVEVVHEALIREWQRLREWMESDRTFRTWQERLRAAMRQWESSSNDEWALLRGALLSEAEDWFQQRLDELSQAERIFIQMSLALRDREIKQRDQRRRRITLTAVGAASVFSILAGSAGLGWWKAESQRINAQLTALSVDSEALFASHEELNALIESLRAGKHLKGTIGVKPVTKIQVLTALQHVIYGIKECNSLEGHSDSVESISFSPDGKTIASASADHTVKLWSLDGTLIKTFNGHTDVVYGISFSPDGKTIASASADHTVKLWSLDGILIKTFNGHTDKVFGVTFSPNGKTIASASADHTVKLWSLDGRVINTLQGHSSPVASVNFSPDGKTIVSGSWDKTVKLWNFDLDDLLVRGCNWVDDYLKTNPNVSESDKHLCERHL